jgi:hypothetical protein
MSATRLPGLLVALALLASSLAPPAGPVRGDGAAGAPRSAAEAAQHVHANALDEPSHPCAGHAASSTAPLTVWKARCPCGCGDAAAPGPAHGQLVALLAARIELPVAIALLPLPERAGPSLPAARLTRIDHVPRAV